MDGVDLDALDWQPAANETNAVRSARTPRAMAHGPSRDRAEAAVRTLLEWAGDDPDREGLRDTPARVARAFEEFFRGL